MSEYKPITGELRDAMETDEQCGDLFGINYLRISEGRLCRMCDAIDAVHAQLERENAALKAELDRVLGEREEHQHSIGEVTVTVTPRLDWSAVVADLRELTALCERTKEDA